MRAFQHRKTGIELQQLLPPQKERQSYRICLLMKKYIQPPLKQSCQRRLNLSLIKPVDLTTDFQETGLLWQLSWYRIHLQYSRPWFEPWVGKIPWRRDLQYSGLENSMDKGAQQAPVHGVTKYQTQLSNFHFQEIQVLLTMPEEFDQQNPGSEKSIKQLNSSIFSSTNKFQKKIRKSID